MSEKLDNAAVIFVSHSMPQIFRVASSIMLLERSEPIYYGSNVAEGIDRYYSNTERPELTVTGSGEAKVKSCRVISNGRSAELGKSIPLLPHQQLSVRLEFALSPGIEDARIQFLLWNQEMIPVTEIVAEKGFGFVVKRERCDDIVVEATIPSLHLNGGRYMLTINIVSPDYKYVYCRHDNAAIINVQNSNSSAANIIMPAEWRQIGH
jgi:lipopolysaccharide transport system ATP-binding protein